MNRAWQRALAAVATGSVLLGDKEEKDKYKMYNEGYVPDLVRPGASAWGTDWIGESKVASPLTKAGPGVGCQDVGHTHAFGLLSLARGRFAPRGDGGHLPRTPPRTPGSRLRLRISL